ncbi:MAG: histidine--tRNA ligase [Deltaproteobacteria bacterium]|nr:histidine--tRNA ligase [Deltaproteobacteria bacterium]
MMQLVRGFRDILPQDISVWQEIEETTKKHFENFGFAEIRPPVVEQSELFSRSIGDMTDIVEKEMFTFPGSRGKMISLRPEATASVVRAYIQHHLYAQDPVRKLYTIGPMFRRERPQKGRYRQFYQINAELFGEKSPYADARLICMAWTLFEKLSVSGLMLHLNSLGCPECRPGFRDALHSVISEKKELLCADCRRRMDKNPMRVLDCKVPGCREALASAPKMADFLCHECKDHFARVTGALKDMNIPFEIDPRLVRGLDYYTRTAFEVQTDALGAQNAVAGGGRYDGLVKALGGPDTPAIGFAVGMDRLVEVITASRDVSLHGPDLFVALIGESAVKLGSKWACGLSTAGIKTETDFTSKSLKALMRRAGRLGASYVLIAGDNELASGEAILRNMKAKTQTPVPLTELVESVATLLKNRE